VCGDREGCFDFFDFDFVFFGLEPLAEEDDFEDDVDETSSISGMTGGTISRTSLRL